MVFMMCSKVDSLYYFSCYTIAKKCYIFQTFCQQVMQAKKVPRLKRGTFLQLNNENVLKPSLVAASS